MSTAVVRNWIRHSDLENLEQVVLSGHGNKLIGEAASDSKIRAFIKATPTYIVSMREGRESQGYSLHSRAGPLNFTGDVREEVIFSWVLITRVSGT
jgi:hypothetical protein